ncbi:MAG: phosphodiester glycosidase family protein [Armatimonadota bacterium]|nr:phosphodiester glycosidase family protein [Armatimonadota bacterium]MDR7451145.1 phosphodiester glycosidase family protein [Armatimonadota bacterium]MDR7467250.1 phosphodiester glycosidase family protein [Armatimonadota bacterium]MDR7494511.1 phosphodiester glycosidase family protein [Armatimonadota bacterium]MDR7499912.1 phosphodiester glycosidase family protein [Armatimonadota bacterium]
MNAATAAPPRPVGGGSPVTAAQTMIGGVEWTTEGPIGKLLIRLDGPVNFRAYAERHSIVLDLWEAGNARWHTEAVDHEYVRRLRIRQYMPGLARIYLDLKKPARYKTFIKYHPQAVAVLVIPPWMATTPLPPSVAYEKMRVATGRGSTAVHVLRVDPRASDVEIRPVIAGDVGAGMETTSVVATRYDAVAGINGGFFSGTGAPLGMVVIDGELVSAPLPRRSVFAITRDGEPFIRAFEFQGRVQTAGNVVLWVSAVNRPPHAGAVAVYTPRYGPLTPALPTAAVVREGIVQRFASGRIMIPDRGYVLAVNQNDAALLTRHLTIGERVTVRFTLWPEADLVSALGGGPRLVKDGRVFVPFFWEWFPFRLFAQRAPRTAVGITAQGKLIFVTVDGRSRRNTGMTLDELARLMVSLGAREAMNLDGGGSATMVVGGRTVNEPSDGAERPVGSALLILRAGSAP